VGFVWAEEKPIIDYDIKQQKHVMCFEDHYGHAPQPRDQEANDPNCNYEFFFSSPDAPLIPVKQAHLLLKALDQIRHRSDIFVPDEETQQVYMGKRGFRIACPRISNVKTFYQGKFYYLDRNAVNCAIYPGWNFLTYHDDKQYYRLDHPAYQWLMESEPAACKAWYREFIKTMIFFAFQRAIWAQLLLGLVVYRVVYRGGRDASLFADVGGSSLCFLFYTRKSSDSD
jgi:hypothetical protein